MWFDFGFDTSHDMEFGKMSKAAHSTLQSSLVCPNGMIWWSYIWDHVDMYWLLVVEVTKLWLTKARPYLNGTIKIRGGSSRFEVGLVRAAYLRCPEQSGSLILCHAHTHTKAVKKFVFPHKMVTWPYWVWSRQASWGFLTMQEGW